MTKSDKRALIGCALIIISIVVIIGTYLYYEVEWNRKADIVENLSIEIIDYKFHEDVNQFDVKVDIRNPTMQKIRGSFEVRCSELKVKNRTVVDEISCGLDIRQVIMVPGNNTFWCMFHNLNIKDGTYKVEVKFVTSFTTYIFDPLLVL